jgi:hypothetical protein
MRAVFGCAAGMSEARAGPSVAAVTPRKSGRCDGPRALEELDQPASLGWTYSPRHWHVWSQLPDEQVKHPSLRASPHGSPWFRVGQRPRGFCCVAPSWFEQKLPQPSQTLLLQTPKPKVHRVPSGHVHSGLSQQSPSPQAAPTALQFCPEFVPPSPLPPVLVFCTQARLCAWSQCAASSHSSCASVACAQNCVHWLGSVLHVLASAAQRSEQLVAGPDPVVPPIPESFAVFLEPVSVGDEQATTKSNIMTLRPHRLINDFSLIPGERPLAGD